MTELETSGSSSRARWRVRLGEWVESTQIQRLVIAVILVNAVVLGLETWDRAMSAAGPVLIAVDSLCLAIFVVEIGLKLTAFGWRFFRSPWNVFDFLVVSVALVPAGSGLEVLRTLRVLRVLRLVSGLPQLRKVVGALLAAIPGVLSTGALLLLILYVSAIMATTFFGETQPEDFGGLGITLFSLFQITTLSSWEAIVRPAMDDHPWAWVFFMPYILISAFAALNLLIAVIVDAMNTLHDMPSASIGDSSEEKDDAAEADDSAADDVADSDAAGAVGSEVQALQAQVRELHDVVGGLRGEIATLTAALRARD